MIEIHCTIGPLGTNMAKMGKNMYDQCDQWPNKGLSLCLIISARSQGSERSSKTTFYIVIAFLRICHRQNMEYFSKKHDFPLFWSFWANISRYIKFEY